MLLTDEERKTGRAFRDDAAAQLVALNLESPPDYKPLPVSGNYRHNCAARKGVSTAIQLREVYQLDDTGRFCFIYKEGVCKGCGQTARSEIGRLDDAWERGPLIDTVF